MINSDPSVKVIQPGRLIDGLGGPVQENMAVVLRDNRIQWLGHREQVYGPGGPLAGATPGSHGQVHEFPQGTLLPGLIDCHTHTNMPGDGRRGEEVHPNSDAVRLLRSARNVGRALKSGVTTVCDCGSWNQTAPSLKEGLALGLVEGSRLLAAGRPITSTGGHLWFMGSEADGVDGVRRRVRELLKEGADFIKVVASGGSTSSSDPYRPSLTSDEVGAIVDEAHGRGKPVAAHCRCTAAINNALDAGVDMILHCAFYGSDGAYHYDQATAEGLAASGVWINPTLHLGRIRLHMLRRKREQEELTAEETDQLAVSEQGERQRIEHFGRLIQMGVKLVGGSDCGWGSYPFGDYQGEVMAMVDIGLSPMEAILAATRNAAEAMRVLDSVGTVEQDKEGDLLVVDGDPTQDIAVLRNVTAVFQGGRLVGAEA
ncbi:MAG: hypothetical protein BZY88_18480 [SAR202 cluster bacterium Io17-Chloro-G9]|nr:MAG: hypothetical protein BZY88_18480 [SAR202 cluster bacterium Io17-Chloro-G9]